MMAKLEIPINIDWNDIRNALEERDIVEVVRCRDCKYGLPLTDANGITVLSCNYKNAHGMLVENHGFCKWGERREDEAQT